MEPKDVILQRQYSSKEEEDWMRIKLAEYYTMFPKEEKSKSNISNFEERCKKIGQKYKEM